MDDASLISNRIRKYAELAYKEALKSSGNQKVGAVVIGHGGRILAKAHNRYDNNGHAERRALSRVPHDAKEIIEFVVTARVRKSQRWGISKPCLACAALIMKHNITEVYYTNDECGISMCMYN